MNKKVFYQNNEKFTFFKKSPCYAFRKIFAGIGGMVEVVLIYKRESVFQTHVSMEEKKYREMFKITQKMIQ